MRCQVISRPQPTGVTRPMPVMTTRRSAIDFSAELRKPSATASLPKTVRRPSAVEAFFDELHRIADGLDVLGRVVGDLDVEFLFEGHNQFDVIEAVCAQIVDEAGLLGDLLRIRVQMLDHDLAHAFKDVGHTLSKAPCCLAWRTRRRASLYIVDTS